jgi:diaminohydroxyphosphoribosylaminopyrimidine deaminase/5-amino-6-(5-phosphoribosylamino)uracil reductase
MKMHQKEVLWDAVLQVKRTSDHLSDQDLTLPLLLVIKPGVKGLEVIRVSEVNQEGFFVKLTSVVGADIHDAISYETVGEDFKEDDLADFFKLYLPYCFMKLFALKNETCFAVSHFAQTLDGKIATQEGSSQWIGNNENLIHAHRMRALCSGILIGRNTLVNDDPSLSVRLVKGVNPIKVVVGSKKHQHTKIQAGADLIEVSVHAADKKVTSCFDSSGQLKCKNLLGYLFDQGIFSLYIEGGSQTTSSFLDADAIEVVQVHISPVILGSGITGFCLPEVKAIAQGKRFSSFDYHKIGHEVMFVGYNSVVN